MEIARLILSILSSSCVIAFSVWYLLDTCDRSSKSKEERSISVEIIAYLYDRAKSGKTADRGHGRRMQSAIRCPWQTIRKEREKCIKILEFTERKLVRLF